MHFTGNDSFETCIDSIVVYGINCDWILRFILILVLLITASPGFPFLPVYRLHKATLISINFLLILLKHILTFWNIAFWRITFYCHVNIDWTTKCWGQMEGQPWATAALATPPLWINLTRLETHTDTEVLLYQSCVKMSAEVMIREYN